MSRYISEFLGTFILVFAGTFAVVSNTMSDGAVTHLGIAITFGLVVLACIYALGDVSGAHLNPAVTIGFWAAKRLPLKAVLPYAISQCAGAVAASATVLYFAPSQSTTLGGTMPANGFSEGQAFAMEVLLTLILMFVILCVSTGSKEKGLLAGVAIGSVVGFEALIAGPFTGASMNPARSLGPALMSGQFDTLWIYLLATPLGAVLAVPLYCLVYKNECCETAITSQDAQE